MTLRTALLVGLAGAVTAVLSGLWLAESITKAARIAGIAGGAALVVALAGVAALRTLRDRSLGKQVAVVALTPIMAIAAAALAASSEMRLAAHFTAALTLVLVVGGTVALLAALALSHQLASGSRSLVEAVRRVGAGEPAPSVDPPSEEFAQVGRELESLSARLDDERARESALDAARRQLVAWASHDLRAPLTRMRAVVEALRDGVGDDTEERYRTLLADVDRLGRLVDDLFELSRINAGVLDLKPERVSLRDIVSDALAAAAVSASEKGVRVEAAPSLANPVVSASLPHFERALANLLDNAIRHTPRGGRVVVDIRTTGDEALVSIVDECGGIAEEELRCLFEPYPRPPARSVGGAGLGLAIAKGIIESHGGTLAAANVDGGCRFSIDVPLAAPTVR